MLKSLVVFFALAVAFATACSDLELEAKNHLKGPECQFCKKFVKEMFAFLRENRTEEAVRDGLDKVCDLIFKDGPNRQQCEHFAATYTRELVEILVDETDPELICMVLGQCAYVAPKRQLDIEKGASPDQESMKQQPADRPMMGWRFDGPLLVVQQPNEEPMRKRQQDEYQPQVVRTLPPLAPPTKEPLASLGEFISQLEPSIPFGSGRSCFECKLFVKYLQTTIDDPSSQEEIKDWLLKNLCENLETNELKSSCRNLVNANAKAFFDTIASQLDPKTTCLELGACHKRKAVFVIDNLQPLQTSDSVPTPLTSSVFASSWLRDRILPMDRSPPPPQEEMISASSFWPEQQQQRFYKQPHSRVVGSMEDKWTDDTQEAKAPVVPDSPVEVKVIRVGDSVCEQCVQIVTKLDEYLSSHSVDHDVDVLVDQVCNNLPSDTLKNECTVLVKAFGEDIVQAIASMHNPKELCAKIYMC